MSPLTLVLQNLSDKVLPKEFDLMINYEGVHYVRTEMDGSKKIFQSMFHADVKIDYTAAIVTLVYDNRGSMKTLELLSKRVYSYCVFSYILRIQSLNINRREPRSIMYIEIIITGFRHNLNGHEPFKTTSSMILLY